jgi:hypothetical protein
MWTLDGAPFLKFPSLDAFVMEVSAARQATERKFFDVWFKRHLADCTLFHLVAAAIERLTLGLKFRAE